METRKPTKQGWVRRLRNVSTTFILAFVISSLVAGFELLIIQLSPGEAIAQLILSFGAIMGFVAIANALEWMVTK